MRRIILPLAVLVLLAAAYGGYWLYFARELRDGLGPWAEARRVEGYGIAWRSAEVAGFPFSFRLHLDDVAMSATRPMPWQAHSDAVEITLAPWNPRRWRYAAPRGASVRLPADFAGIEIGSLEGSIAPQGDATVVVIRAHELAGSGTAQGLAAASLDASVTLPANAPQSHGDTVLALTATVQQFDMPRAPPPLARRLDTLSVAATLKGALPAGPLDRALAAWRDGGGTIEINALHLAWGSMTLDLDGTLALDAAMQPEGALTATIVGGDKMIDAVVASGAIEPRYAGFAKSVLRAISTPDANGADAVHVPLTMQDRQLFIGPAPIATLPRITWQ